MKLFVTGIGTGVGKTVASAILCEALHADYWKPVQSGNLDDSDTDKVRSLISNTKSVFHPETYRLKLAASPHKAARAENKSIRLSRFKIPSTRNHLIIEGAGGLLVPLNEKALMIDLIANLKLPVILVSRHYLGSINHTLLSVEALKARKIPLRGILFNGDRDEATESIVLKLSRAKMIGRIQEHQVITRKVIGSYARLLRAQLAG